jgi:chorismate synthase
MAVEVPTVHGSPQRPPMTRPRPGHADLAGGLKYDHRDLRNVLERASARETAIRVAVGGVCKCLLRAFGVRVLGHVVEMGGVRAATEGLSVEEIAKQADASPVRCADPRATREIMAKVDEAQARGTSVGGVFEVLALGVPVGLGTHVHWDLRLDGRLAQALMSIQAIKGVEIGPAFEVARRFGCEVQDEIFYRAPGHDASGLSGYFRQTNFAGGLEGGVTTGQPIVVRAAMKPISSLVTPLHSFDLSTLRPTLSRFERSDACAVPAAGVVTEAMVATVIANALLLKIGGDHFEEIRERLEAYRAMLKEKFQP